MANGTIVNISGLDRLEDALVDLSISAGTPHGRRPLMKKFGLILEKRTSRSFKQETAPEMVPDIGTAARAAGRAWKPLADSTADAFVTGTPGERAAKVTRTKTGKMRYRGEKGKRRGYATILQVTGTMKRTVIAQVSSDAQKVTVGTSSPIAVYHAGGTKRMDARPFLGVDVKDVDTMLNQVKRHLSEAMG